MAAETNADPVRYEKRKDYRPIQLCVQYANVRLCMNVASTPKGKTAYSDRTINRMIAQLKNLCQVDSQTKILSLGQPDSKTEAYAGRYGAGGRAEKMGRW